MSTSRDTGTPLDAFARETLEACDGVLVRVWVVGPGDLCTACALRPECPDQTACLHLVASVGLTTRLDGPFRRFPIGARRVGRVVADGRPYLERGDLAAHGLAEPAWLALHGVRSFAAVPLGGGRRGVLAVFSRRFLTEQELTLLAFAARTLPPPPPSPPAAAPVPDAASAGVAAAAPPTAPDRRTLAEIERDAIERALLHTGGRVSGPRGAATLLGLKPSTLASRMKKLRVRRPL